jgi:hypothetical protein
MLLRSVLCLLLALTIYMYTSAAFGQESLHRHAADWLLARITCVRVWKELSQLDRNNKVDTQ